MSLALQRVIAGRKIFTVGIKYFQPLSMLSFLKFHIFFYPTLNYFSTLVKKNKINKKKYFLGKKVSVPFPL